MGSKRYHKRPKFCAIHWGNHYKQPHRNQWRFIAHFCISRIHQSKEYTHRLEALWLKVKWNSSAGSRVERNGLQKVRTDLRKYDHRDVKGMDEVSLSLLNRPKDERTDQWWGRKCSALSKFPSIVRHYIRRLILHQLDVELENMTVLKSRPWTSRWLLLA